MFEMNSSRPAASPRKANQPAYILWLIRTKRATNLRDLGAHFGEQYGGMAMSSVPYMLEQSLMKLKKVGLIEIKSEELRSTPLCDSLREVLGISLTELAAHDLESSLRVSPLFGLPREKGYHYDICVLMPFRPELQPVYEDHIKRVASDLRVTVARADDFFTDRAVMEEIWAAIAKARVLIADCTGRNPNVFYEIGIAHTLGKPVILVTQDGADVPFDLRHRRHIEYQFTPRGMSEFEDKLKSTITEVLEIREIQDNNGSTG
jgi:hypothetical protein